MGERLLDKLEGRRPDFMRKETSLASKGLRQFLMA